MLEVGVTDRLGAVEGVLRDRDDFLAGTEAQRRVVAHPRGDGGEVTLTERFLPDLRPQSGQLVEFRQPDSVDVARRERGGGVPRDRGQVAGFTAGDLADADPVVGPGERRQFAAQQSASRCMAGRMVAVRWAVAASRTAGSASHTGSSSASSEHRQRQVPLQLADGVIDADGGRGPPVRGLRQVPLTERVEGRADLRQPAEVARGGLGAGDGHGGHRLEDQALPADVALRRRVGGPQRVLGVGAGALDESGEYRVVDALGAGEASWVDLADLAADGRELLRGAFARLPARVEGQPVEFRRRRAGWRCTGRSCARWRSTPRRAARVQPRHGRGRCLGVGHDLS